MATLALMARNTRWFTAGVDNAGGGSPGRESTWIPIYIRRVWQTNKWKQRQSTRLRSSRCYPNHQYDGTYMLMS